MVQRRPLPEHAELRLHRVGNAIDAVEAAEHGPGDAVQRGGGGERVDRRCGDQPLEVVRIVVAARDRGRSHEEVAQRSAFVPRQRIQFGPAELHRSATLPSRYSTRRRPLGSVDGSALGSSTTNSVRWAGKRCSLTSTGVPSIDVVTRWHLQQRRADRHLQQRGVLGSDAPSAPIVWVAPRSVHVEQLVERLPLDLLPREPAAERLGAPHGDDGERLAVGEVDAA